MAEKEVNSQENPQSEERPAKEQGELNENELEAAAGGLNPQPLPPSPPDPPSERNKKNRF